MRNSSNHRSNGQTLAHVSNSLRDGKGSNIHSASDHQHLHTPALLARLSATKPTTATVKYLDGFHGDVESQQGRGVLFVC